MRCTGQIFQFFRLDLLDGSHVCAQCLISSKLSKYNTGHNTPHADHFFPATPDNLNGNNSTFSYQIANNDTPLSIRPKSTIINKFSNKSASNMFLLWLITPVKTLQLMLKTSKNLIPITSATNIFLSLMASMNLISLNQAL